MRRSAESRAGWLSRLSGVAQKHARSSKLLGRHPILAEPGNQSVRRYVERGCGWRPL